MERTRHHPGELQSEIVHVPKNAPADIGIVVESRVGALRSA